MSDRYAGCEYCTSTVNVRFTDKCFLTLLLEVNKERELRTITCTIRYNSRIGVHIYIHTHLRVTDCVGMGSASFHCHCLHL